MSTSMNAVEEFAARIQPEQARADALLNVPGEKLEQTEKQVFAHLSELPLPSLTPEERQQMVVRHADVLPELLLRAGTALGRHPDLARAIGTTPETLTQVAQQGFSARSLIRSSDRAAGAGRRARYLVARTLAEACDRTAEAAEAILESGTPAEREKVRAALGGVTLLEGERMRRQKLKEGRYGRRLRALLSRKAQAEQEVAALSTIGEFLSSLPAQKDKEV